MEGTSTNRSCAKEVKGNVKSFRLCDPQQLKNIKVAIRRPNIPDTGNTGPLLRSLDDAFALAIHRADEGQKPIFDRDDVIVNKIEERIIVKPEHSYETHIPSTSRASEHSDKYDTTYSQNSSPRSHKSRDVSPYRSKTYKNDSSKSNYRRDNYRYSSPSKYRHSQSPRRSKSREKSPYTKEYKKKSESGRNTSPKEPDRYKYYSERVGESKLTKNVEKYRRRSPAAHPTSHSPHTSAYKQSRHSRSPPEGYRGPHRSYSQSKYKDDESYSSLRRSRSPHRVSTYNKGRRSNSPRHSSIKSYSRRSRSPKFYKEYKRSRSPEEYRKHKFDKKERSRSLSRERYKRESRRSRSPYHKRRPTPESVRTGRHTTREVSYVGPVIPELAFYGPEGYWVPAQTGGGYFRPPIAPPMAPAFFRPPIPRGFLPRPRFPPLGYNEHQRLPVYNNRIIRPLPNTTEDITPTTSATITSSEIRPEKNESTKSGPDSTISPTSENTNTSKQPSVEK